MKYVAWNVECVNRHQEFDTKEEAQAWCQEMNEKWAEFKNLDGALRFTFGTEKAYEKAREAYMADVDARARAEEERVRQGFFAKLDTHIRKVNAEREALGKLIPVCEKFAGKVLNKRFKDAACEAMGEHWGITLGQAYGPALEVYCYDNAYAYGHRPDVSIYKSDKGYDGKMTRQGWDWVTGSRLDAEKAVAVLTAKMQDLQKYAEEIEVQRGQYDEYMEKRSKAAAMIRELDHYGFDLKNYCKENVHQGVFTSSIW